MPNLTLLYRLPTNLFENSASISQKISSKDRKKVTIIPTAKHHWLYMTSINRNCTLFSFYDTPYPRDLAQ